MHIVPLLGTGIHRFHGRADLHVSVIIPVYNGERFLLEAIRDVQEQGHAPLEIIVIDDGSSDGTAALLTELGDQVRTVRQANRGSAAAQEPRDRPGPRECHRLP